MNRSRSLRSSKHTGSSGGGHKKFSFSSLRNAGKQNELSSAMYSLIKTENGIVDAYEKAAHSLNSVAHQLSAWGEATEDDHISDISDKLGVLMSELADVEENFAQELEDSRVTLKQIRNTESSVQPSRDQKQKLIDQIHLLKHKDPQSTKLVDAEQALVRAEAENLVAEAQLTNIQRHALKETYLLHFQAIVERAEKSLILAEHGRRVLELLDDTPVVPGDSISEYTHEQEAKQILLDCESELQSYQPKPYHAGQSRLGNNLLPEGGSTEYENESIYNGNQQHAGNESQVQYEQGEHTSAPAIKTGSEMKFSDAQQSSRAPIAQSTENIQVEK